jgi:nucleotide-binding universal stress UspA family protein
MARSISVAIDIGNLTDSGKNLLELELRVSDALARRLKTAISLLYVEDLKTLPRRFVASRIRTWRTYHEERMKALKTQFTVPVTSFIKTGPAAAEILKALSTKPAPELVVMGSRGKKGLKRLLIGSVAEEVVRHAKRPVMVIGGMAWGRGRILTNQKQLKFLLATDLGTASLHAERYALSLAGRVGARVVLFHSLWDRISADLVTTALSGKLSFNLDKVIAVTRDNAIRKLKKKAGFFQARGVPCEFKIEKAVHSSRSVHQEGEKEYSYIIMGTRGRNALLSAYFGSTARETILNATIPVITVH